MQKNLPSEHKEKKKKQMSQTFLFPAPNGPTGPTGSTGATGPSNSIIPFSSGPVPQLLFGSAPPVPSLGASIGFGKAADLTAFFDNSPIDTSRFPMIFFDLPQPSILKTFQVSFTLTQTFVAATDFKLFAQLYYTSEGSTLAIPILNSLVLLKQFQASVAYTLGTVWSAEVENLTISLPLGYRLSAVFFVSSNAVEASTIIGRASAGALLV